MCSRTRRGLYHIPLSISRKQSAAFVFRFDGRTVQSHIYARNIYARRTVCSFASLFHKNILNNLSGILTYFTICCSPPPDSNWRRTNSDSALHQSCGEQQVNSQPLSPHHPLHSHAHPHLNPHQNHRRGKITGRKAFSKLVKE